MIANRSPAGPTFIGSTTLSMAEVATAASIALPPFFSMSSPTCAARGWLVVTMPFLAITSDRRWVVHPSDRSPATAAHHAGAGAAPHDWIGEAAGDCATMRGALPDAAAIASAQTTLNDDALMRSFFRVPRADKARSGADFRHARCEWQGKTTSETLWQDPKPGHAETPARPRRGQHFAVSY